MGSVSLFFLLHLLNRAVAHIVYAVFGLVANTLVTAMLLLGGAAALNVATGTNKYAVSILMPLGYLPYTYIGGLKAKVMKHVIILFSPPGRLSPRILTRW